MIKKLIISRKDLNFIKTEINANMPYEACGIMVGTIDGHIINVEKVISVTNIRCTSVSFELDPQQFYNVWNDADKDGKDIVGIYHTHPAHSAVPSSWDISTMKNVHSVWLIAGVDDIRGYVYEDGIKNVQIYDI
jgi:proteasome lid subunit RPN8/RPN11